ncbi:MAG: nucleotidyltransferase domain-containing protein [Eubacteriales bacterium]|nr:nucleotidyltransferase domain-containing protein [Eubacteriales bacterium]
MRVQEVIEEAVRICGKYAVRRVVLFGSRAKGTALERSDIDLAVSGATDFEALREEIEEIPTLYTVDLVDLDVCRNELLLEDIAQYGREIYKAV